MAQTDNTFYSQLAQALTPTQMANLFPRYYRDRLPDISGFNLATEQIAAGTFGKGLPTSVATGEAPTSIVSSREKKTKEQIEADASKTGKRNEELLRAKLPKEVSEAFDEITNKNKAKSFAPGNDPLANLTDSELKSAGLRRITVGPGGGTIYSKASMSPETAKKFILDKYDVQKNQDTDAYKSSNENISAVMNTLIKGGNVPDGKGGTIKLKGLPFEKAKSLTANFLSENTSLDVKAIGDKKQGLNSVGIGQWNQDRKKKLYEKAEEWNMSPDDLYFQGLYSLWELQEGNYKKVYKDFMTAKGIEKEYEILRDDYEVGMKGGSNRANFDWGLKQIDEGKIIGVKSESPSYNRLLQDVLDGSIPMEDLPKYASSLQSEEDRLKLKTILAEKLFEATAVEDGRSVIADMATGKKPLNISVLNRALKLEGMDEHSDRKLIQEYLRTGGAGMDPAVTPWCAAFVNSTLAQSGIKGSGSAIATSFAEWGINIERNDVEPGDIMVMMRGREPYETGGHVGFFTGNIRANPDTGEWEYEMYGGNQSDAGGGNDGRVANKRWRNQNEIIFRRAPEVQKQFDLLETATKENVEITDENGNVLAYANDAENISIDEEGNVTVDPNYVPTQEDKNNKVINGKPAFASGGKRKLGKRKKNKKSTVEATATAEPERNLSSAEILARASQGQTIGQGILDRALRIQGLDEVNDRKKIKQFLKNGGVNLDPKEVAWCAAVVNSAINQYSIETGNQVPIAPVSPDLPEKFKKAGSTYTQFATSFLEWGQEVPEGEQIMAGDVLVDYTNTKGNILGPHKGGGHVGLSTGKTRINPDTGELEYEMYGGNQSAGDDVQNNNPTKGMANMKWRRASELKVRRSNEQVAQIESLKEKGLPVFASREKYDLSQQQINYKTAISIPPEETRRANDIVPSVDISAREPSDFSTELADTTNPIEAPLNQAKMSSGAYQNSNQSTIPSSLGAIDYSPSALRAFARDKYVDNHGFHSAPRTIYAQK